MLEQQGVIGAFDKRTIIDLSSDVIKEIAQKYENVQKGVGDMMRGALIETSARTILNQGKSQGISETKKETALRMLKRGKLTIEEIAEDSGLSVAEVEQLHELIDRITIYETPGMGRCRKGKEKRITIYYKFVGAIQ